MGTAISAAAFKGFSDYLPPSHFTTSKTYKEENNDERSGNDHSIGESLFDKLYMYPIFASDRRVEQRLRKRQAQLKPIIMHGHHVDKEPRVIDMSAVLRNLDSTGELEKNSAVLTSLLIAQFDEGEVLVNYAYGFSKTSGKCYFFKQGNFSMLMSKVSRDENMNETNVSSKKAFLCYLHQLMNSLAGSVWLNGFCISGPESPCDRIPIESVTVNTMPARVTLSLKDLTGINCIRTKSRLEIYARAKDDATKAIWFRGDYANTLVVTDVQNDIMSILIPAYCQTVYNNS